MKIYSCEAKGANVALTVHLNEYKLYSSRNPSHGFATSLRPWMEKENLLRIEADHSPAAPGPGEPVLFSLEASIVDGNLRQQLAHMEFPGGVAAPDVATMPFDTLGKHLVPGQSLAFVCPDPAAIIDKPWRIPGRGLRNAREVYELYGRIQQAFLAKDIPAIIALSQARIQFGAQLYEMTPAEYEEEVRSDLVRMLADDPQWQVFRNPQQELTVHEYLPRKVMRVLNLKGSIPLMTVPDRNSFRTGYDVIVAVTRDGLVWIM